jgi:YbbR domain-containing protein
VSEIQALQGHFAVTANLLIDAYGDIRTRGHIKDSPDEVAAALEQTKALVRIVEKSLKEEGPVDYEAGSLAVLAGVEEFSQHSCSCPWCIRGYHAP